MITPEEIRKKAKNKYQDFLKAKLLGTDFFPLIIRSDKKPSKIFEEFQKEQTLLISGSKDKIGYGYKVDSRQGARLHGGQQRINLIYFESEFDYLKFLSKLSEIDNFILNVNAILNSIPQLKDWIICNPLKVIDHFKKWDDIIKVCKYFIMNPKPNLYIRELPISISTKFIEENTGIIKELLDYLIPEYINNNETEFEKRFNLKFEEPKIRILILDQGIASQYFNNITDLTINISQFNNLTLPVKRIIILENKVNFSNIYNFLTLPHLHKSIAIFGKGFGVGLIKDAKWMHEKEVIYWGDIDSHGFKILSLLRRYIKNAKSIMMDMHTLNHFEKEIGDGVEVDNVAIDNLFEDEVEVFTYVNAKRRRLEQEKINYKYATEQFLKII